MAAAAAIDRDGAGEASVSRDTVVVGGGVVGLAVANALLRAGVNVVSVSPPPTDKRPEASRAAGAMLGAVGEVTSEDTAESEAGFEFRLRAQRLYPEWLGEICERAGVAVHQGRGTFVIANNTDARDRPSVRAMRDRARGAGERAEFVEPEDVPGLKPNPQHAPGLCLHLPGEHSVDADQLLAALSASVATFSGWSHLTELVVDVRLDGDGWTVTTHGGYVLRAERLVLCAGSRAFEALPRELRDAAGLPELYFGKGISCIVSGGPSIPSTIRTPNRAFACGIHVVPRAGGLLYLGATNQLGFDHDADRGASPGEIHNLIDEVLHQISTDIRETRIEELRVGYRPIAAHGRPVIGETALPGLSVATGTYRDGMLMAPLVGQIIAADAIGAEISANPFPVGRAGASAPPDSLVDAGVRDIITFIHEPRGELPYDRAEQLRKYVTTLFRMAVDDNGRYTLLREQVRARLRDTPLNETMHTVFRDIVRDADERGD
jgi:glycine oxidase